MVGTGSMTKKSRRRRKRRNAPAGNILVPQRPSVAQRVFEDRPTEFSSGVPLNNSTSKRVCYALMGATGVGKTVTEEGLKTKNLPLFFPEKDTTRPVRGDHEDPRRHIPVEEFQRRREQGLYFLTYSTPYAEDHESHAEPVHYAYAQHELERGLVTRNAVMSFTFPSTVEYVLNNLASFGNTPFIPIVITSPLEMLKERMKWRKCSPQEKDMRMRVLDHQNAFYEDLLSKHDFYAINNFNPQGLEDLVEVDRVNSTLTVDALDLMVRKASRVATFYDLPEIRGKHVPPTSAYGKLVPMTIKALFDLANLSELRSAIAERRRVYFDKAKCELFQRELDDHYSVGIFFDQVYAKRVGIENGVVVVTLNDYATHTRGTIKSVIDKFLPGIVVKKDCYTYRFALTDRKPFNRASNSAPYALEIRVPEEKE